MKTYAEKLQELIDENDLNYSRLEKNLIDKDGYTTVTRQTISKHCSGSDPNLSTVKKLAEYFNVPPMYLIDDNIENKDSLENIEVGQVLKLSDTSIKNINSLPKTSKNILLESNFFTKSIIFIEMIKDLEEMYKDAYDYNDHTLTLEEKIADIEKLQKLCDKFYNRFTTIMEKFFHYSDSQEKWSITDYFDALGARNTLENNKKDVYKTNDALELMYIDSINRFMHSVQKSIKVIHSEMKDALVFFIKDISNLSF